MSHFDAIVIGAGPGGYVTAIRLAQLGKKTAIIERESIGGVCLNTGCIPSKALIFAASQYWKIRNEYPKIGIMADTAKVNWEKTLFWKNGIIKKLTKGIEGLLKMNGVTIVQASAAFKDDHTVEANSPTGKITYSADNFVIATGSRVTDLPFAKLNGKTVISSTEALELKQIPKKMVVIGGGIIGLELGTIYAKLGTEVTIVEALSRILANVDPELVLVVEKKLRKLGANIITGIKVLKVSEKDSRASVTVDIERSGKKESLATDLVLVSIGRRPNSDGLGLEKLGIKVDDKGNILTNTQGQTNLSSIYAIGDVTGPPQLAHRASMDGMLVAETIAGKKSFKDYQVVPWAIFTDPEIAVCGLSENEAKQKNIAYRVGKFPFAASGKALAGLETDGFIKVLVNNQDESILGVHIVGPEASMLIAEATLAIELGATVDDVIRTIHTHPTLAEAFPEAIEAADSRAIHIFKPSAGNKSVRNVTCDA